MEKVWENECRLVPLPTPEGELLEMGLDYGPGQSVMIAIDVRGWPELLAKLKDVPVRITISRVPGGND
jgi:hypothetical protein